MKSNERSGHQAIRRSITILGTLLRVACFCLFLAGFLMGCSSLSGPKYPTLIPTEYVPTAIALTVEAGRPATALPSATFPGATDTAVILQPSATFLQPTTTQSPITQSPSVTSTPRKGASPTLTPAAGEVTLASNPTATASLPPVIPEDTLTPGPTSTVTPTYRYYRTHTPTATPGIPNATILLYNPGPMSKLTSPIQFNASLEPGPGGNVEIVLLGEDSRILYRKVNRYTTHDWVAISEEVEFTIAAAAETARLQISTDDEFGRVKALASVDILLLSMGDDDLNPGTDLLEPLIVREPVPNTLIMGGKVVVTGLARTSGEQPLLVELIDSKGKVVGYRQAVATQPADPYANQGYATFKVEVPYSVDDPTWVRLVVSAFEDNLSGPTHLSSVVILLGP
jgi:hypothetical protein